MTKNEKELLDLVRGSNDPEQALVTAVQIITEFVKQLGSSQ
jgi:hypothetical protein